MKYMIRKSLLTKTIAILFLMIFPLNILSIASSRILFHQSVALSKNALSSALVSQMGLLDGKIENTNYLLYHAPNHNTNYIYLQQQNPDDWKYAFYRYQFFNDLYTSITTSSAADYMFVYLKNKNDFFLVTRSYSGTPGSPGSDTFRSFLKSNKLCDGKWHLTETDNLQMLIRIMPAPDGYIGSAILLDGILHSIEQAVPYENYTVLFSEEAPGHCPDVFSETASSGKTDLYLNMTIADSELETPFLTVFIGLMGLIFLAIIPLLYLLFRREIAGPLHELNHAHMELKSGNEDYRITSQASSAEFSYAYGSFNEMAYTLKKLRIENLNKALAYNQLQLDNLRLQIRPHFLQNTMNLLYALTQTSQLAQASELILYLSDYFRYMFRSDKDLQQFEKELNLIKKYLHVSQISYPDEFTISYQIDPVLSLLRVPPLLFHNFIENIIQHTLTKGRTTHIVFFGEYEDGTATFQISDDGPGMDPVLTGQINARNFSSLPKGTHIGIQNSVNRLLFYYGEKASLYIDSELEKGTTITITIPCNLEEEDSYETIDCK